MRWAPPNRRWSYGNLAKSPAPARGRSSVLVMLGSRGDLDGGRSEQRRTENRQDYLSHRKSPSSALSRDKRASRASPPCPPNSDRRCELLRSRQSRSGEQNCWSRKSVGLMFGRQTESLAGRRRPNSDGLLLADPVQWGRQMAPARENDEKAFNCNPPDLIAGLGANETVTQARGRAKRTIVRRSAGPKTASWSIR